MANSGDTQWRSPSTLLAAGPWAVYARYGDIPLDLLGSTAPEFAALGYPALKGTVGASHSQMRTWTTGDPQQSVHVRIDRTRFLVGVAAADEISEPRAWTEVHGVEELHDAMDRHGVGQYAIAPLLVRLVQAGLDSGTPSSVSGSTDILFQWTWNDLASRLDVTEPQLRALLPGTWGAAAFIAGGVDRSETGGYAADFFPCAREPCEQYAREALHVYLERSASDI